jgi:hypothetical protein
VALVRAEIVLEQPDCPGKRVHHQAPPDEARAVREPVRMARIGGRQE